VRIKRSGMVHNQTTL